MITTYIQHDLSGFKDRRHSGFSVVFTRHDRSDKSANIVHMDQCFNILSYVKLLSHAKDIIPDICRQHLNN